jgi:hypothetical protein
LAVVAVHLFIVTKMVIDYATAHPQPETSPSSLSPFIGRERDSHDVQWETYRSNLPILGLCMLAWWAISPLIEKYGNEKAWLVGTLILAYSFRSDFLIYLAILTAWYLFTIYCFHKKYFVSSCWAICIILLYLNELTSHFEALSLAVGDLMPLEWMNGKERQISCGQVLNMTFLRLLSFAIDKSRGSEQR